MPARSASILCVQCVLAIYQYKLITSRFDVLCQLRKSKWGGRRYFSFTPSPPYSPVSPTPTPSDAFLSLPKPLPNLNLRCGTRSKCSCIYMTGCFYERKHPSSFCPILLSLLNAHCVIHKLLSHFQSAPFKSF